MNNKSELKIPTGLNFKKNLNKRGKNKGFFHCNFFPKNRRGQIWVETVIYTLIAFTMIGLVLSFSLPEIEKLRDKAIIEQSIEILKGIDSTILGMGGPGNQRLIEVGIKKGVLKIDGGKNLIAFEIESRYIYSEHGINISDGNLIINTMKTGEFNLVSLTRDYSGNYDITYQEGDELKLISKASRSYDILISNQGGTGDIPVINFEII